MTIYDGSRTARGQRRHYSSRTTVAGAVAAAVLGGLFGALGDPDTAVAGPIPFSQDSGRGPASGTVYSISVPGSFDAGKMLMISDANGRDQALTLQPVLQGPVTAASSAFEFTPRAENTGGTLTTGYGQLKSRWTGTCITATNTSPGATVGASDCNGADTQQWQQQSVGGNRYLVNKATSLGVGFGSTDCKPVANVTLNLTKPGSGCGTVSPTVDSYTYFTKQVSGKGQTPDPNSYSCVSGYRFTTDATTSNSDLRTYRFNSPSVFPTAIQPDPTIVLNPQTIVSGTLIYRTAGTGMTQLQCDPVEGATSSPTSNLITVTKVGSAGRLLEVNGATSQNLFGNGGVVDIWQANGPAGPNGQWTYVPSLSTPGYGQLVSRVSGKCLERNGNTGGVDQWTCAPNSANHLWRITPSRPSATLPAGVTLQNLSTGEYLGTSWASDYAVGSTVVVPQWTDGSPISLQPQQSDSTIWAPAW